jgi:CheY-like chemotaxis protein
MGRIVHILLVEDHRDTATALQMLLTRKGYYVTVAYTIPDARGAAAMQPPDVLLADIMVGEENGRELVQDLKSRGPLKAIALTGLAGDGDRERNLQAGFDRHLSKPCPMDLLVSTIEELCGDRGRA